MSLRIANSSRLPRNLFQLGSDIDKMVDAADAALLKHAFIASTVVSVTRDLIHKSCPDYEASHCNKDDVLCSSGEKDGHPCRFDCKDCRVSQFSPSGFFTGEIVLQYAHVSA